jgi:hypothetical protein
MFKQRFFAEGDLMILGTRGIISCQMALMIGLALVGLWGILDASAAEQSPKVLILPFQVNPGKHQEDLRAFSDHVNKRLRSTADLLKDRYTILTRQAVDDALKGKSWPENDSEAHEMATQAGADLVLYGVLSESDGAFRMKAVMWDMQRSRQAVTTELKVGNIHGLPAVLELFVAAVGKRLYGASLPTFYRSDPLSPASAEQQPRVPFRHELPLSSGPWRSPAIGTELWALAVGDLLGDGKNEVVLLEDGGVSISRFENGGLKPLTQFSRAPARFLAADIADLDGDGVAELVLCAMTPQGIGSMIIKYQHREFKILQTLPNTIVRAIREPSDPKRQIIVGQRTDNKDMFSGEMVRFAVRDGQLVPDGTVMLPPGTLLLSYVAGELGPNKEFIRIILNQDQRLLVFDRDNRPIYQATDRIYGLERGTMGPLITGGRSVFYPGKLMIADTSDGAENELLVIKQSGDTSAIHALVWDGTVLAEKWKTIGSRGIISDFAIQDFKNEGVRSLALILVEPSPFPAISRARSIVFAYDLIP